MGGASLRGLHRGLHGTVLRGIPRTPEPRNDAGFRVARSVCKAHTGFEPVPPGRDTARQQTTSNDKTGRVHGLSPTAAATRRDTARHRATPERPPVVHFWSIPPRPPPRVTTRD